jgi:hypothetical protein
MSASKLARVLALASGAALLPAGAVRSAPPDPAAAAASVPALGYTSLLTGFRPLSDDALKPWHQANDSAAAFGGWRAYAREARRPEPPDGAASGAPAGERRAR